IALNRAFKDRDHEKVTHPTGGLIFAMVVNFLMSTVVNILVDIHKGVNKCKNKYLRILKEKMTPFT
ncbi:hypothetical protein P4V39_05515, partial [Brevibacillus borstelensis]|uniref:hypothetical protein n=1 Tax=Brevibacillus borstelensis TaxID=45462 RepID=UPI002E2365D1|nr:hypothetical protein [Brevibacillus borstelensis]